MPVIKTGTKYTAGGLAYAGMVVVMNSVVKQEASFFSHTQAHMLLCSLLAFICLYVYIC